MRKSSIRALALVLAAGSLFQLGGCLNRVLIEMSYQIVADIIGPLIPTLGG